MGKSKADHSNEYHIGKNDYENVPGTKLVYQLVEVPKKYKSTSAFEKDYTSKRIVEYGGSARAPSSRKKSSAKKKAPITSNEFNKAVAVAVERVLSSGKPSSSKKASSSRKASSAKKTKKAEELIQEGKLGHSAAKAKTESKTDEELLKHLRAHPKLNKKGEAWETMTVKELRKRGVSEKTILEAATPRQGN